MVSDLSDSFNSSLSPTTERTRSTYLLNWLRFFLDSSCEAVPTLQGLNNLSIAEFEEIIKMLLHHPNSALGLCDIQNQPSFLSFALPSGFEDQEDYRVRLAKWQRVVDRFQLDYTDSSIGPTYLSLYQCCPKNCHPIDIHELDRQYQLDKGFEPRQVLRVHNMPGADKYARHRIFHEFLLRNRTDPCLIDHRNMTPTLRAIEQGTLDRWLEALNNAGIRIEAVALHTLRIITPDVVESIKVMFERNSNGLFPRSKGRFLLYVQEMYESLTNVATFREYVLDQLARNGCYVNILNIYQPNTLDLRASGVSFVPSTRHDPAQQNLNSNLRRRTAKTSAL